MTSTKLLTRKILNRARLSIGKLLKLKPLTTIDKIGDDPLVGEPISTHNDFIRLQKELQEEVHPTSDSIEREFGAAIDSDWLNDLALHTQIVIKKSGVNYQHGRILYAVLRDRIAKFAKPASPMCILETGTARGFSSLCMTKALIDTKQAGSINTIDILPHDQAMYWNCIDDLEGRKSRRDLLKPWNTLLSRITFIQDETLAILPRIGLHRIHFAFLDASHTFEDVMFEFEMIKDRQEAGDVIVFDDVTETLFPGVVQAVENIKRVYNYKVRSIEISNERGYAIAVKQAN